MKTQEYNWPLMKDSLSWADRLKLAKFVMTADRFTQGEQVAAFEEEWSKWLGVDFSLFVTSGSTANLLLLDAVKELFFDNKKGIKVLVPACTWVTNINPVFQLGMTPIFCDVNLEDYSFDIDHARKIALEHEIDIVFTTHLLGLPASRGIHGIFPNAIHLDDVCESHGAKHPGGMKVGSINMGSTFSFYYGHHMSTIEGGMISTNHSALYDLMKMKRSHGMSRVSDRAMYYQVKEPTIDSQFLFVTAGYNFRNTELAAVLGRSQLKRLDSFIEKRRRNFRRFEGMLRARYSDMFYVPEWQGMNSSFCFPLIAKDGLVRTNLEMKLIRHGIEYRPVVGGNLLKQPYLAKYKKASYPNADFIHYKGLYVGNNQFVGNHELDTLEEILGELKYG